MSTENQEDPAGKSRSQDASRASTANLATGNAPGKKALFCTNCGQVLSEGDNFCGVCGTRVKTASALDLPAAPLPNEPPLKPTEPKANPPSPGQLSAFIEMWSFIIRIPVTSSSEKRCELRRQAKKRMRKTIFLTLASPVVAFMLALLSYSLAAAGEIEFFFLPMAVFLLTAVSFIVIYLYVAFAKLKDEDRIKSSIGPFRSSDVKDPQSGLGWLGRLVALIVLTVIILVLIPIFRYASEKLGAIASVAEKSYSEMSASFKSQLADDLDRFNTRPSQTTLGFTAEREIPVADTSDAVDINFRDHSSLSPGTICKISNYRVLSTKNDGVIATFDHLRDYKAKSFARNLIGDGPVSLAELAENSSKPNIAIITNRNLCDDDAIPTLYARYEGTVDTFFGRLRCFREVRPKR